MLRPTHCLATDGSGDPGEISWNSTLECSATRDLVDHKVIYLANLLPIHVVDVGAFDIFARDQMMLEMDGACCVAMQRCMLAKPIADRRVSGGTATRFQAITEGNVLRGEAPPSFAARRSFALAIIVRLLATWRDGGSGKGSSRGLPRAEWWKIAGTSPPYNNADAGAVICAPAPAGYQCPA